MTRGGQQEKPHDGTRRCLVLGDRADRSRLVRFVLSPDQEVVPDVLERLPGRGAWLSPNRAILARALQKNAFARAFGSPVKVDLDLVQKVETALLHRVVSLVALARKAGAAISGAGRVHEALVLGEIGLLLQAHDGSERERANIGPKADVLRYAPLTCAEQAQAFGRERVVHIGIVRGRFVEKIAYDARRLEDLRYIE